MLEEEMDFEGYWRCRELSVNLKEMVEAAGQEVQLG
jgi:hypothetical protein